MKVRCRATTLTDERRNSIGGMLADRNSWALSTGDEYLVLGLTFSFGNRELGTGAWIEYENRRQGEYLLTAPLDLFEIVDAKPSVIWDFQADSEMATLWPNSFYRSGYRDRLSDGAAGEVADFRRVKEAIARGQEESNV